jgi:hypothetical protein
MKIRSGLALALIVICAAGRTVDATGQQGLSSDLRMQLVSPGREPVDPKPGPPPADFPKEVLPRGTVPVASGTNGNYTIVVGTLPSRPSGWRAELLSYVAAFGWISQMPAQSGFVMGSADSVSICKGTDFVDVALSVPPGGSVNVRAVLTRDPRRQCASRGPGSTMSFADVMFPVLEPPPGGKMSGGGGGGSNSEWTSHTQLTSELSMAALADHYRRQIVEAGWNEDGSPAFLENSMVIRFKAPSKIGPALPAMLIINVFDDPHQFDVFLRLTRPPERSR